MAEVWPPKDFMLPVRAKQLQQVIIQAPRAKVTPLLRVLASLSHARKLSTASTTATRLSTREKCITKQESWMTVADV